MKKIVPIVEGDGEITALPPLLYKLLHEIEVYDILVSRPKTANGRGNLTKQNGIERFVTLAMMEPECGAVLVLLDADDDCPRELAFTLAERIKTHGPTHPVVVVVANRAFENWFLAGISGKFPLTDDVEKPNGKKCLTDLMPPGHAYKETEDQEAMVHLLDIGLARDRSRSFRRLCHAVEEAIMVINSGNTDKARTIIVTPAGA